MGIQASDKMLEYLRNVSVPRALCHPIKEI